MGLNESGKTTILQAINYVGILCKGTILKNGIRNEIRPKGTSFTGNIVFGTEIQLNGSDKDKIKSSLPKRKAKDAIIDKSSINIQFRYGFENHSFLESKTYINNTILSSGENDFYDKLFQMLNKDLPDIIYYEDFVFEVPNIITFSEKENDVDASNLEWKSILNDIYNAVKGESGTDNFLKDVVNWLKNNPKDDNTIENRMQVMGNKMNEIITEKWKDIAKDNSVFQSIVISRLNGDQYSISVKSKNNTFKLHERSKGFRWFFAFLILTEFRKSRKKNTIFLLDEPAAYLHAVAQERIKKDLDVLCDGSTVIFSTHSPYLLDYKHLSQTYLVKNESSEYEDPKISCSRVSEELKKEDINKKTKDCIKPLIDHIAFVLPTILSENNIKSNNSELKEFLKKITTKIQENYPDHAVNTLITLVLKSFGL